MNTNISCLNCDGTECEVQERSFLYSDYQDARKIYHATAPAYVCLKCDYIFMDDDQMYEFMRRISASTPYNLNIHQEENGFWAECVELPGCMTQGDSMDELTQNMGHALSLYLEENNPPEIKE